MLSKYKVFARFTSKKRKIFNKSNAWVLNK